MLSNGEEIGPWSGGHRAVERRRGDGICRERPAWRSKGESGKSWKERAQQREGRKVKNRTL